MKNQYNIQRGILKSVWCLFVWCLCYSFCDSSKFQLKSMTMHFLYPPQKAYLTELLCGPPKLVSVLMNLVSTVLRDHGNDPVLLNGYVCRGGYFFIIIRLTLKPWRFQDSRLGRGLSTWAAASWPAARVGIALLQDAPKLVVRAGGDESRKWKCHMCRFFTHGQPGREGGVIIEVGSCRAFHENQSKILVDKVIIFLAFMVPKTKNTSWKTQDGDSRNQTLRIAKTKSTVGLWKRHRRIASKKTAVLIIIMCCQHWLQLFSFFRINSKVLTGETLTEHLLMSEWTLALC